MTVKLGPHYLAGGEDATLKWLALKPTVAKFYASGFELANAAADETLCIGRPEEHCITSFSGDPIALARQCALEVYLPHIQRYPAVDAWEGPNECNPGSAVEMSWYASFLAELGKQLHLMGCRAVLGAWAVGTPEMYMWQYYRPVLQACRDYNALLSRHAYGPLDEWYSFRHRQDQAMFRAMGFNPTVVITECGADKAGSYPGGWKKIWGTEQEYWTQHLRPFLAGINQDPYVLGATVFTVGTGFAPVWEPYNVGQITLDCIQADCPPVEETTVFETKLFQLKANPLVGGYVTLHSGPDLPAFARREVTYLLDVYQVRITQSGVWFQVTPDGTMWMRASDCLSI
jgi:hypothetical protein